MQVVIAGKRVTLAEKNLLGVGGEARVYGHQGHAIKIFHAWDNKLSGSTRRQAMALDALREKKIVDFPSDLPPEVIAPAFAVQDAKTRKKVVGYGMRRLHNVHDILHLARRRWREGVVSNQQLTELFRGLYLTLQQLHNKGVCIGDLNDGNVMFSLTSTPAPGARAFLIDADSMQFASYPCVVAHERFLDPQLYGVDLAAAPAFSPNSDWYSFSVLLFCSLLYVHPYGGVHPDHPTLLRRAEASLSLLAPGVKRPKLAADPAVLPADLRDHFEAVFDGGWRGVFPAQLLEHRWHRCKGCGVEHAHPICPACGARTQGQRMPAARPTSLAQPQVVTLGTCQVTPILTTKDRIVLATVEGSLRYLIAKEGTVQRENGHTVIAQSLTPDMRFAIAGGDTWIGLGKRLVRIQRERCVDRVATETFAGLPSFDANGLSAFYIEEDTLIEHFSGRRFGQVLGGQTWFRVGPTFGLGFYRAGLVTVTFLFETSRPGLRMVELPDIVGHFVDAQATFDDNHVLFSLASENAGRRHHSLFLLRRDGSLVGSLEGAPDESPLLSHIGGKALFNGRLLVATDLGLASAAPDASGRLVETRIFRDTNTLVSAEAELLPGPAGSVYVATTKEITQLSLC